MDVLVSDEVLLFFSIGCFPAADDDEVQLRVARKRAVWVILRGPKASQLVVVDREPQCNPTYTTSLAGLNWAYVLKLSLFKTLR